MHPFTGLALLLPLGLLAMRIDLPSLLAVALALLLVALGMRPLGGARLRQWALVLLPLALGLTLVHGRYLDSWLGQVVDNRQAALLAALRLWLRVAIVLAAALLWLSSITTASLTRALFASRLPPGVAYLLASPLLLSEQLKARLAAVSEAQAARGVDVAAPFFRRWRSLLALAAPLVVWTLSDVGERAAALDARAFRSRLRRTTLDAPQPAIWERWLWYGCVLLALVLAGSLLWR
ncbi:energy-coupling factor transporter transmembrane protein EcfT [Aquitalea sp. S1-19]|nr:energy-coupling factor transporter transmembrane protein EcfT [Aquitalea sp. S1-19]